MIDSWLAPLHRISRSIERGTLDNGIPWILLPNEHASLTSVQLWFRRGSCDDPVGRDGTAHFLEHMMFRGSKNVPDGVFDERAERHGIEANAMTWLDYTAYLYDGPASSIDVMLQLEVDRLGQPTLADQVIQEERKIILNERATQVESDPDAMIDEFISQHLPRTHPYRRPVLGTRQSIQKIERSDLDRFQSMMKDPRELFVVATGNFSTAQLRKQLDSTLGKLPLSPRSADSVPGKSPIRWQDYELPKLLRFEDPDIAEPRIIANLRVPGHTEPDAPLITLLGELLDRGPYGILEEIFEDGQSACVSSELDVQLHRHSSVGGILLVPSNENDTETIAEHMHERLLNRIRAIKDREVEEARQRIALRALSGIDHTAVVAEAVATHELYNRSDERPFRMLEEAVGATREQVIDFAERWLSPDSRSLVIAVPKEETG